MPLDRCRASRLVIGLVVVTVLAWWLAHEGGFGPGAWYPGALLLLALLVVATWSTDIASLPRRGRWSVRLFAAFTAWSYLSIMWASSRGDAWDAANRSLLYLTVFLLFGAVRWRSTEARAFLIALALLIAVAGAWEIVAALAGDASTAFSSGRLAGPIGYENATAALFAIAFWPALVLAVDRASPRGWRATLLATAAVLLELCVLAQSRASLLSLAAGLVCALALTRERGRLLLGLSAVAVVTLVSLPALLAVFNHPPDAGGDRLGAAAGAMAVSAVVMAAAGWASPRLDAHRGEQRLNARLHFGWAAAVLAAIFLAGALAASSRFTAGIESGRYDFWRVALSQVADHPLQGAGAGNFENDYERERHRHEQPQYPHSIVFGTFGQTGIVGGLLLLGFLATALLSATRLPVAVAAAAAGVGWLAHASLDWLWEMPAVTAPAMACLGLVVSASASAEPAAALRLSVPARAGALGLAIAAAISYALPALAAREIERAARRWDDDPAAALGMLDRARRLNPLSDRADLVTGALALGGGDRAVARAAFRRAADRDHENWYPQAALGVLDLEDGHTSAGVRALRIAQRRDPREATVVAALAAAQQGIRPPAAINQDLLRITLPGPLGRRPVSCRPLFGLAAGCAREFG